MLVPDELVVIAAHGMMVHVDRVIVLGFKMVAQVVVACVFWHL